MDAANQQMLSLFSRFPILLQEAAVAGPNGKNDVLMNLRTSTPKKSRFLTS
jgi:hypothetical protein